MPLLWQPRPLWELPPCPYVNNTPPLTSLQKLRMVLVGVTLFLPRLLLLLFTLFSVYGLAKLSVIGWPTHPRPTRCDLEGNGCITNYYQRYFIARVIVSIAS